MKKTPFIIAVPMIAVALVVGGAVLWKMLSPASSTTTGGEFPNSVGSQTTGKPASFLGGLLGGSTPSPTPASSADLSRELKNTVDDGGTSDLNALKQDASGL